MHRRRALSRSCPAATLVGLAAGACFNAGTPPGAVILCVADRDCPPSVPSCDLRAHACTTPGDAVDIDAPQILSARFDPFVAREGAEARLTLELDEPALGTPTFTFAGGASLPLERVGDVGTPTLVYSVVVGASDPPEGTYALVRAQLVDAIGNAASRSPPGPTELVIDRRAPVLDDLQIDDATPGDAVILSDLAGTNAITLSFRSSEVLDPARIGVQVGQQTAGFTCALRADIALGYACAGALVAGAVLDGANAARIDADDAAGNRGFVAGVALVDAAAPAVEPGSLTLTVERPQGGGGGGGGGGAGSTPTLHPGDRLRVTFVTTEPLAVEPDVVLDAGALFPLTGTHNARAYDLSVVYAGGATAGAAPIVATFRDAVGHTSPASTIATLVIADVTATPCPIELAGAPACIDFDGDGQFGASATCASFTDCDDDDPLVGDGFLEIPGDGLDNDCAGDGDLPIDESTGVFFALDGSSTGTGTRVDPTNDLPAAIALAEARPAPSFVYLAIGSDGTSAHGATTRVGLVGGLDPAAGWTRGGVTALGASAFDVAAPVVIEGLFTGMNNRAPVTLVRSTVALNAGAPFTAVSSNLSFDRSLAGLEGVRIIRSTVAPSLRASNSRILVLDSSTGPILAGSGADITLVSSVVDGTGGLGIDCAECATVCFACNALRFVHSNLVSTRTNSIGVQLAGCGRAEIVHSNVHLTDPGSGVAVVGACSLVAVVGSVLDAGFLIAAAQSANADAAGLAQINTASNAALDTAALYPGFAPSILGNPNLSSALPTFFRVDQPSPATDGLATGAAAIAPALADGRIPTAVAGDFEGDCRYRAGSTADIGPDER